MAIHECILGVCPKCGTHLDKCPICNHLPMRQDQQKGRHEVERVCQECGTKVSLSWEWYHD